MWLSRMRLRATQIASCRLRLVSSTIMRFPPRTKMVTDFVSPHPSTTKHLSLVVPNATSFTALALPSLSGVSSWKRGTMRPPVAMASSSSSTPPTQRTAGSFRWYSRWFASSSNPHWHMTRLAPLSRHCCTMSSKYFLSAFCSDSYFSTVSMSSLCFVFGFGGSNGHVRMAMRASSMRLGICGWLNSLSMTRPCTRVVSSSFPPTFPSTLMRSRLTSLRFRSATATTACTQISAICLLHLPTILLLSVVMHVCTRFSKFCDVQS
mmetsp:Transcript_1690/g.3800  ORF Transcript_1690/g.3800 Transcript_1690/m.3800 type:complete len:264 (+) Transcript_1690:412-1203(+)